MVKDATDLNKVQELKEEEKIRPFSTDSKVRAANNKAAVDFGAFKMRRLDILDDFNKQQYKKLQK